MFGDEFNAMCNSAKAKAALLKNNPLGYFISAMLAGMYIGFGGLITFTAGGILSAAGSPFTKVVMGIAFSVALSFVIMGGAELFTGNNMVMAAGSFGKQLSWAETVKVWIACYLGNLAGSVMLAVLYHYSGLGTGDAANFMASSAAAKMTAPALNLFIRGILCNMLVCLAVWCTFRCKSESGKLFMTVCCIATFMISGFEHSVANMTLFFVGLLNPCGQAGITVGGFFYNLVIVTAGNLAGGVLFMAFPYYLISKKK